MIDGKEDFSEEWEEFLDTFEHDEETDKFDPSKPPARLVLDGEFRNDLLDQALELNEDFLVNAQFQFAEYIGLSMIQLIFDKNLESPDFIEIFASENT